LEVADDFNIKSAAKIVWLGGKPSVGILQNLKRKLLGYDELDFPIKKESFTIQTNKIEGEWLVAMLAKLQL
jgi:hypothetical protein